MPRKYSKLFWCGLFVTLFGGYQLITSVLSFVTLFSLPASLLANYTASTAFTFVLVRLALFTVLYVFMLAAGVYVLWKGIIREQSPPPMPQVEQPTNEPAP